MLYLSRLHNDSWSKSGILYLTKKKTLVFITMSAQTPPVFSKYNMSPKTTDESDCQPPQINTLETAVILFSDPTTAGTFCLPSYVVIWLLEEGAEI